MKIYINEDFYGLNKKNDNINGGERRGGEKRDGKKVGLSCLVDRRVIRARRLRF